MENLSDCVSVTPTQALAQSTSGGNKQWGHGSACREQTCRKFGGVFSLWSRVCRSELNLSPSNATLCCRDSLSTRLYCEFNRVWRPIAASSSADRTDSHLLRPIPNVVHRERHRGADSVVGACVLFFSSGLCRAPVRLSCFSTA